jgi:hypothetical protein
MTGSALPSSVMTAQCPIAAESARSVSFRFRYFAVALNSQLSPCEVTALKRARACCKYNSSTFFRAHGVLRKNFKLDLMLGSCVKQRTSTTAAIASQPMRSDSWVTIISRVMPSRLGWLAGFFVASIVFILQRRAHLYSLSRKAGEGWGRGWKAYAKINRMYVVQSPLSLALSPLAGRGNESFPCLK